MFVCVCAQLYVCFLVNKCCFWNSVNLKVVLCEIQPAGFIHGMRSHGAQKHPCHGRERNTAKKGKVNNFERIRESYKNF